jgi:hypothetical protein
MSGRASICRAASGAGLALGPRHGLETSSYSASGAPAPIVWKGFP